MSGGSLQPGKALELHAGFVWSSSRQYGFNAYASPEAGSDFKHFLLKTCSCVSRFTQISADWGYKGGGALMSGCCV